MATVSASFSFNEDGAVKRLLVTILVWAVTSSQATGQNKVSQTLPAARW